MANNWQITFENKNKVKLNKPVFIEGLPGIANVGKIAVDFLVEDLKAKKLCSFYSYSFPHSVFVNEKNLVEMPKIEIYYKKFNNPKKNDLLLLTGDVQPIDEESCYSFCEEILKFNQQLDCQEIITTGGIGLQSVPEKPNVYCTSNDKKFLKTFNDKKLKVNTKIFGVVGPIMGVSGILVGLATRYNISAAALLAETFGHQMYLGVKGAKELLRVLDKRYNLNLDIKRLGKEILEIENEVMKKTKEWFGDAAKSGQAGAKPSQAGQSYIG
jgi:uncharacterized protein